MLAALFLVTLLARDTCADCALNQNRVRLCAAHVEQERAAFNAARKPLASKLETERSAALEALSRLTHAHQNAPSERVARSIADALADESWAVRERAATLLGPPQHALVAMEALLEALSSAEKDLVRVQADRRKLFEKRAKPGAKQSDQVDSALEQNEREQEALLAWRRTVLAQLASFPDERVVNAVKSDTAERIAALPEAREIEDVIDKWLAYRGAIVWLPSAMDVNAPLVRLGSRDAIRAVITNITVLHAEIDALAQPNTFVSSGLPELRNLVDEMQRNLTAAAQRSTQEIEAALVERGFGGSSSERANRRAMLEWLQRNVDSFPERLPGVLSPAW